jgi:hypothetical protein
MNRRAVLASVGIALSGFGGCVGGTDHGSTGTPTNGSSASNADEPEQLVIGEPAVFDDGTSMTVTSPTVQTSIIVDHSAFLSVERVDGHHFVVVDVDSETEVDPSTFVIVRDGVVDEPPQSQQTVRGVIRECGGACIAVSAEVEAVDSAAVGYRPDGELRTLWELDDSTVTALSAVSDLRLQHAALTDADGKVGIEFTVENHGDRDGTFLALVVPSWVSDVSDPVGFSVPVGDSVTKTVVPSEIQSLDPSEVAFADAPTEETRRFVIETA